MLSFRPVTAIMSGGYSGSAPSLGAASSISTPPPSFWDRASTWASDNKATVYTIAGVTVVVSAGAIYYYSSQPPPLDEAAAAEKRKARKDKKKAKKEQEKSGSATPEKKPAPEGL